MALAALEYGITNPEKAIKCKGHKHPYELYGVKYHCWKKQGHGFMKLRNAIKQSCDTYFYETARLLGVDKLSIIAKRYGLGSKVLEDVYIDEKQGLVPNTIWKRNVLEISWYLGETVINGIGQGYIQTTPLQLCFMTAQLANRGYKIKPHIIYDETIRYEEIRKKIKKDIENYKLELNQNKTLVYEKDMLQEKKLKPYKRMYKNQENIEFVLEAMYASSNEMYGTSFKSRYQDPKYQFAGKTGTSQIRRITEAERKLGLKQSQIEYKRRDHALYIAFAPYQDPRYSISVHIEHGGSGSNTAAPIARKIIKKVIDRHKLREQSKIGKIKLA